MFDIKKQDLYNVQLLVKFEFEESSLIYSKH